MSKVTVEVGPFFKHDERVQIFTMCDRLASAVGIAHIKAFTTRKARITTLEYRLVLNFGSHVPVDLGEVVLNVRFLEGGFVSVSFGGGTDFEVRPIPDHLESTLQDGGIIRSWFVQRQMIVGLITELADKLVRGIGGIENVIRMENRD